LGNADDGSSGRDHRRGILQNAAKPLIFSGAV
jgi:hypothetical protein